MTPRTEEPDPEERQSNNNLALKSGTRAYARVMVAERLIQTIRGGRHESNSYLARNTLTHPGFVSLLKYIESEKCAESDPTLRTYFNEELQKEFLIRMSSFMHDALAEEIGIDIGSWLRNIQNGTTCSDEGTIDVAKGLGASGTALMTLPMATTLTGRKGPDKAYQHSWCDFPGLVIEVAWSQRKLDLPQLAEDYILGSQGEIKPVIGINIHDVYAETKGKELENKLTKAAATFTIWTVTHTNSSSSVGITFEPAVKEKKWRLPGGKANESVALQLTLQDFVCDELASCFEAIENPRLLITSQTLCRHYELAKVNHLKEVARVEEKNRLVKEAEQAAKMRNPTEDAEEVLPQEKKRTSIARTAKNAI